MKIFQLHSLVPGVRYYRMTSPAKHLSKKYKHDVFFENTSLDGLAQSEWQKRADDQDFHEMLENLLKGVDILVTQLVHCEGGLAVLYGISNFFKIPIVLDCDDDVENVPFYNRGSETYKPNTAITKVTSAQLRMVDAVTVTTDYLQKQFRKHNHNVHVLPNSIDLDIWDAPVELPSKKSVRIGWAGAQTHEEDIKFILPAIKEVLRRNRNVKFYFVGGVPDCIMKYEHKRVIKKFGWYDILDYPKRLRQWQFDIGIAPLVDNNFNRAKSNLRWLEYSALGIPCVAGNVEPYRKSINHGKTGMLAYETEEWVECLEALIKNVDLRRSIGTAAHKRIKISYNMAKNVTKWNAVYETAILENQRKLKLAERVEV